MWASMARASNYGQIWTIRVNNLQKKRFKPGKRQNPKNWSVFRSFWSMYLYNTQSTQIMQSRRKNMNTICICICCWEWGKRPETRNTKQMLYSHLVVSGPLLSTFTLSSVKASHWLVVFSCDLIFYQNSQRTLFLLAKLLTVYSSEL